MIIKPIDSKLIQARVEAILKLYSQASSDEEAFQLYQADCREGGLLQNMFADIVYFADEVVRLKSNNTELEEELDWKRSE